MKPVWPVSLTDAAEADLRNIIQWTFEHFGEFRAKAYSEVLIAALLDLSEGADIAGARRRDDISSGLRALHVARKGRKGRHFVLFRVAGPGEGGIEVLRILHDAMDLPRHFAGEEGA